jgi:EthD domain-containing protein
MYGGDKSNIELEASSSVRLGMRCLLASWSMAVGVLALSACAGTNLSGNNHKLTAKPAISQQQSDCRQGVCLGPAKDSLERPPYLATSPGGNEPLTVIFSFLSRADNTSLDVRPRAPANLIDLEGHPIPNPADPSAQNAFGQNPNINFEKWGDYWRKVHGVRFTYTEDTTDTSLQDLLRYDQLHRAPGGPTHLTPPPYHAPSTEDGRLYDSVIGRIPAYQRSKWDGVAYLQFQDVAALGRVLSSERFLTKIVPEDHAIFRTVAPVIGSQYIIRPSMTGREAVSLVITHTRRPGLSRAEFLVHLLDEHARVVLAQPTANKLILRYVQIHNQGSEDPADENFIPFTANYDAVSVLNFATMNDVEDYLMSPGYRIIEESRGRISASQATEYWTSTNFNIVSRIAPEAVTGR